ncbi:HAD family hydrolase [Flavobacterium sp.]
MIHTVIFDMDGVIVDTEPVHHYAYQQHFKQLGIEVTPQMYASFTGGSTKNIYSRIKEHFNLEEEVDTLVQGKRTLFNAAFDNKEDLYLLDGVEELIKELHGKGMQLVLASSSANETINRIFKRFNLERYFTHKVSGEDFPNSKPHPALFLKAAQLSQTSVEHCVVIEDSTNGIKAAKAANIYCIGYDSVNSALQDYSLADEVISDFKTLSFDKIKNIMG